MKDHQTFDQNDHFLAVQMRKQMTKTIVRYHMIEPNDRVMVAVSGGKDSSVLLKQLLELQKKAPFKFDLFPVLLDQKQPGFEPHLFQDWIRSLGLTLMILEQDTYSIVQSKTPSGSLYCTLCSRLRRGILYNYASKNHYHKIALGHHREDLNETLLMNLFYTGKMASMPPKLVSDDKRNVIIRPLINISEEDIQRLAKSWQIPTIPCNLCGSQNNLNRKKIKALLKELQNKIPHIHESLSAAHKNVHLSHLSDDKLWSFETLLLLNNEFSKEDVLDNTFL